MRPDVPGLFALALFLGLGSALPTPSSGQLTFDPGTGISSACDDAGFRQFDYWLGSWIVRNEAGQEVGRNTISRLSHGCALLEAWVPTQGPRGTSMNFRDPATGRWHQLWVGGGGLVLRLEGGIEDGAMTLSGGRSGPDGTAVVDRIRWIPLPDGRVEQRWDVSTDGGESWQTTFRGFYEKEEGPG